MTHFLARVTVPGRLEVVRPTAAFLVETARALGVGPAGDRLFEVAIVEALTNALEHNARQGEAPLHCDLELDGHRLTVRVLDEAAREPLAIAVPSAPPEPMPSLDAWELIPERGYGLHLMRAVFPDIRPVTRDGRHGVEMALTF